MPAVRPPDTAWCPERPTPVFFSVAVSIPGFTAQAAEMQSSLVW